MLLNATDDLEQVAGAGIAGRSEHAHQALGRLVREGAHLLEPGGGVDVVAQYDLARIHVSCKQALDTFLQQPLAKCRVAFGAGLHDVTSERHRSHLLLLAVISAMLTR